MSNFKKGLAIVFVFSLLTVGAVGGTIAWLTSQATPVVNTFTTSDITVELKETTGTSYKMVPGCDIDKDPKATVKAGSVECWLFVELDKSANFDTYLTYTIADGWALVAGETNVYARKVEASNIGTSYSVLKDNKVTVLTTVTKEMMNSLTANTLPTLTVTAYASQLNKTADEEFTAAEAWANID